MTPPTNPLITDLRMDTSFTLRTCVAFIGRKWSKQIVFSLLNFKRNPLHWKKVAWGVRAPCFIGEVTTKEHFVKQRLVWAKNFWLTICLEKLYSLIALNLSVVSFTVEVETWSRLELIFLRTCFEKILSSFSTTVFSAVKNDSSSLLNLLKLARSLVRLEVRDPISGILVCMAFLKNRELYMQSQTLELATWLHNGFFSHANTEKGHLSVLQGSWCSRLGVSWMWVLIWLVKTLVPKITHKFWLELCHLQKQSIFLKDMHLKEPQDFLTPFLHWRWNLEFFLDKQFRNAYIYT